MDTPDFEEFFNEMNDNETEQVIQYLVDNGAAEWNGMDEYGERMYKFNMETLEIIMPELYKQIMEDVDQALLGLFEAGLASVEYNEDLEALITLTPEGQEALRQMGLDHLADDDN
jgi:hypothetical protein